MPEQNALKQMKILTIDDDQWIRNSLTYYFRKKTLAFVAVESAEEALELIKKEPFDIVICDYKLPGMDGLRLLGELKKALPRARTILITAYGSEDIIVEAHDLSVDAFVQKPFTTRTIEEAFDRMLAQQEPFQAHLPG